MRDQIKVLQVVGGMNRAGVETWLMHVLRNIDRRRYHIDFLTHTPQPSAYDDEIKSLGSKVIPCLDPSNLISYSQNFRDIIRQHGPYDIIHSHVHHFSGFVLKLAKREGIPCRIVHSHCDTAVTQNNSGLFRRIYLATAKRWIDRYATIGLAVSSDSALDLFNSNWESDPRMRIFRLGFDLTTFASSIDRDSVRAELGIPRDAFVVGHVGRFDEQKNHTFLADIAIELARLEQDIFFLLVGVGALRPSIEKKIESAGLADRVLFAGSRPDIPKLMLGAMDVFLFPSLFEGLPVVLIEAQAAGLRCIVSDTITDEGDVVDTLIQRLSLEQPASEWALAVLSTRSTSTMHAAQKDALVLMESSPFNINVSLADLENIYSEACHG